MKRSWHCWPLVCCLVVGCGDDASHEDTFEADPHDPVICLGDPDTSIVCRKSSEFWSCETMPNGEVKCKHKEPVVPDGEHKWTCLQEGGKVICTTDMPGAEGGSDWRCQSSSSGTTCTKDAPVPPGGGSYSCSYDNELDYRCTGKGPTPPPPGPPAGGAKICFQPGSSAGLPSPPEGYWATITAKKVKYSNQDALYIRVTFSKAFVDNTYGTGAIGYHNGKGGHSFKDLVGSDKAEIFFNNAQGDLLMQMAVDYISVAQSASSGYGSLGVTDGDGKLLKGAAADVLAWQSSLSVNFNKYGYVLTENSPTTDKSYTANPKYPNWIFDVWYEVWVKWSVFGKEGPGKVYVSSIHASPSKLSDNTLKVYPGPCP